MSAVFRSRIERATRTVSSNEAKQHWGEMIKAASEGEDVVVEVHGKPKTVMISVDDYQDYRELKEKHRREELLHRLEAMQRRQAERNKDLTDEQIEEIAVREGREINRAVAEKLKAMGEEQHTR